MSNLITRFGKAKVIVAAAVILIVIIAIIHGIVTSGSGKYQFVTVTQGSITEVVSVTGNTTPVQSLDLSFETGGVVAAVYKNAGDAVNPGDALVKLDTRDLAAQLAQAQASVDAAQASLEELQAGPTPQNVQVSQTALASAEQTLANTYAGVENAITVAYAQANDAVRNQVAPFYSNPESNNPQLTFTISDGQVLNDADFERIETSQELNMWQAELNALSPASATSTLEQALVNAGKHLTVIESLLNTDATAVVDALNLPAGTSATYKTDVANAVKEVDDAASSISTTSQSIASEEASIAQAQAALNVTLAGSTSQAIAAQQAQVEEAQANTQSIQVNIAKATLNSPIAGVVTVQNAKVGEVASPGQTITSIISDDNLEVDAYVPETDIGKVAIGNPVSMTFDAFPGETFTGKVFYIDPAQTIVSGVVDYLVKTSFDKADPRIKSGLTANLSIETQTDQNALILPQFAVTQNASGTFIDVLKNGAEAQVPVTLGIQDQDGNVEVASGVTAGEQVINIGLKAQ